MRVRALGSPHGQIRGSSIPAWEGVIFISVGTEARERLERCVDLSLNVGIEPEVDLNQYRITVLAVACASTAGRKHQCRAVSPGR